MSGPPPPYPGNPPDEKAPPYPSGPAYGPPYGPSQAGYPPPPPQAQGYGAPQPAPYPPPGSYPPPNQGYAPRGGGYPPPNQGYAPQAGYHRQGQTTVVVSAQPPITLVQTFQSTPVRTCCPHCRAEIVTATHFESGTFSWVMCIIICLFGCDLGCCLIPFCLEACQDVIHSCPNCHQQIARWSRM